MKTRTTRSASALALTVVLCALVGVVVVGSTDARPTRTDSRCPMFTGPVWKYTTGSTAAAPLYTGTRYTFAVNGLSCPAGLRLIRKVIPKTAHAPSPAALLYLKGYGCIPASRWLYGKKMFAGNCAKGNAAGTGPSQNPSGFQWEPVFNHPTSKRIN